MKEEKITCFPNKTDRIVLHLKKCSYFFTKTTSEIQNKIFSLITKNNDLENLELLSKQKCKQFKNFSFIFFSFIFYYKLFFELIFFSQLHMIQLPLLYLFPIILDERLL